jgi:glycosyltransferase involved in cell wall biosynthesis
VVIPCYNEPQLIRSLTSLWECTRPAKASEIIVVINSPENCDSLIAKNTLANFNEAKVWIDGHNDPKLRFHLMFRPKLPYKFAGVGLARKIGMDEAAYRLHKVNNIRGIIAGFDADSLCDANYLIQIEQHFQKSPKTPGASVRFEHPVSGSDFEPDVYQGIIYYELHLRYMNQALRYTGHPHAWHTVGSSFAVRMDAYVKQGGMNKRQAGEDFYFLQKIIALGNFSEINTTRVIPSPRESDRVPFGTGASMKRWMTEKSMKTYNLEAYSNIKKIIGSIDSFYYNDIEHIADNMDVFSPSLSEFLLSNQFMSELTSVKSNSASLPTFRNRFFAWFNAFKVIKYLHFAHEKQYQKADITIEACKLAIYLGYHSLQPTATELLTFYRKLEMSGFKPI